MKLLRLLFGRRCQHVWEAVSIHGPYRFPDRPRYVLNRCRKCRQGLVTEL